MLRRKLQEPAGTRRDLLETEGSSVLQCSVRSCTCAPPSSGISSSQRRPKCNPPSAEGPPMLHSASIRNPPC
eukprot:11867022-Alexandrium_andersonii.AAC.1